MSAFAFNIHIPKCVRDWCTLASALLNHILAIIQTYGGSSGKNTYETQKLTCKSSKKILLQPSSATRSYVWNHKLWQIQKHVKFMFPFIYGKIKGRICQKRHFYIKICCRSNLSIITRLFHLWPCFDLKLWCFFGG